MADALRRRLDAFGRQHPRLMLLATVAAAVAITLILVYNTKDTAIVYRAF